MRLSVLLTTFNRSALLREVLESLKRQVLPRGEFELIVIDDGSTDDTAELVGVFADALPIRYYRQQNVGIGAARNHGLMRAGGDVILLMDDDDAADERLLIEHLAAHEENPDPEVAILGFTKLLPEIAEDPLMSFVTNEGGYLFSYGDDLVGRPLDFDRFWGGRVSFKREFVVSAGGFNPAFKFGCEDIELGYRLSKRGLRVLFNPKATSIMLRRIEFDDFCARLYRQGQSQRLFSQMHEEEVVQSWCEIPRFLNEWLDVAPTWRPLMDEGRQAADAAGRKSRSIGALGASDLEHLHNIFHRCFAASKMAGIAGATDQAPSICLEPKFLSANVRRAERELSTTRASLAEAAYEISELQGEVEKNEKQAAEYLYHLNRINSSPWWRFGMWVARKVNTPFSKSS